MRIYGDFVPTVGQEEVNILITIHCGFFKTFKKHADNSGEIDLGTYVSGEGTYDSDPMVFDGGDKTNCNEGGRSTIGYCWYTLLVPTIWYCWYTAFPEPVVSLDKL